MKNQTLQQSLLSFSESLDENSQLLTLFPVVQSNNFGTVAQETSYKKLSVQLLVAINRNHL